jgi:CrcB protein
MKLVLYLALGGTAGTLARYLLQGALQSPGSTFPAGTLIVNLAGSFVLGFLMRYLTGSLAVSPDVRAGLTIGFCGAFTTMSTFAYESVLLLEGGEYWRASAYAAGSVGGSVLAVIAGLGLAGRLL